MTEPQFVSLWPGPWLEDCISWNKDGTTYSSTWLSAGAHHALYGLDRDGHAWILCEHAANKHPRQWFKLTDFLRAQANTKKPLKAEKG